MDGMTKKETILEDKDVRRWYDNLARGSGNTAEVYIRRLSLFCEKNKTTPRELARMGRKAIEDMLQDHVTRMESMRPSPNSPGYVESMLKGVKSWLAHNEVELKRRIKVRNPDATPSISDERVPNKDELKAILANADLRGKAGICLIAEAGLRLEVLGNESGTDGLTIGDLPELIVRNGRVSFKKIPARVVVRPELSKAGHRYFTFDPEEGCGYLVAYLNKRLAGGEVLHHPTPVIAVTPGYELKGKGERNRGSRFITTRNVSRLIREAIRPSFKWRPYVLRAYFDSQMLVAENHGKVGNPYRIFFMGHKGDMEARYTTHKGRLPDDMVEDMRESFKRCQEYLQTAKPERETGEILAQFKKQLLMVSGYKETELSGVDLESMSNEQLQKMARERLVGTLTANGARTLIVSASELEDYLKRGYDYVDSPPALNGRSVIRFPN